MNTIDFFFWSGWTLYKKNSTEADADGTAYGAWSQKRTQSQKQTSMKMFGLIWMLGPVGSREKILAGIISTGPFPGNNPAGH